MVERKFKKWQLAFIVGLIFIIPVILVFQYTKADIVINIDTDFKNQCFFGQSVCTYDKLIINFEGQVDQNPFEFRETENNWQIIGDNVFCIHTERSVAVPVSDPVGVITEETEVSCNNIAVFDKDEWNLQIRLVTPAQQGSIIPFSTPPPPPIGSVERFTFTMIGT